MYAVVGCGNCDALWIVEGRPETTGCPRCGKRHRFDRLKRFAETDGEDGARLARAALLAERSDHGEAFADLGSPEELSKLAARNAVPDDEYLGAAGLDVAEIEAAGEGATSGRGSHATSRGAVVRGALRDLDAPTRSDVLDYAADRGVPPDAAGDLLERLVRSGEASEDRGRYRLL